MKLKGIIQTGRTSRFEMFQSQPAPQPTGEIRGNGAVTHRAGEGEGPNRVISSCRWISPSLSALSILLLPAALSVHMLYVLGGPEDSAENWVHPALFHQVVWVKKE